MCLKDLVEGESTAMFVCEHWEKGNLGALDLANGVIAETKKKNKFKYLYSLNDEVEEKIKKIATNIYKAKKIQWSALAKKKLKSFKMLPNVRKIPVCIAKTPYSFSSDPKQLGAASNHILEIRDIDLKFGAGFIVVICGPVMTMPGLPNKPAAEKIKINNKGELEGLF
jgi:formate--tetrahydrofolate ligase